MQQKKKQRRIRAAKVLTLAAAAALPRTALAAYSAANTKDFHVAAFTTSYADGISGSQQVGTAYSTIHAILWHGTSTFVDLHPAGYTSSEATANSGTQQAGTATTGGNLHAMLWNGSAASKVDLHPAAYTSSFAFDTSGTQQVGYAYLAGVQRAMRWTGTAASASDLHPAGYSGSIGYGAGGTQQVGAATTGGILHAMLWNGSAASAVDLHPVTGYDYSEARDVSGTQQVGLAKRTGQLDRAMLWNGSAASYVDLNPSSFFATSAWSTNGTKQAGYGRGTMTGNNKHALVWSGTAASYQDLHALAPGTSVESQAYSIDAYDNVAGYKGTHAVIWYAGNVFHGLDSSTWNDAANWTSGIPTAAQDVLFIRTTASGDPVFVIYPSGAQPALNNLTIDNSGGGGTELFVPGSRTLTTSSTLIGVIAPEAYVHLSGGGRHVTTTLSLGTKPGGVGNYDINGASSLTTTNVKVGEVGTGHFFQFSGSHIVSSQLTIAANPSAVGTYQLSAGTLTVNAPSATVLVGAGGSATMTQSGGTANINLLLIGSAPGSGNGTYNLNGAGVANVTSLALGGSTSSTGNSGILSISAGAMTVTGAAKVWNTSGTTLNLSGGTLSVGSLDTDGNSSKLNWTGGTLEFTNSNPTIGSGAALGTSRTLDPDMVLRLKGNSDFLRVLSSGTLSFTGGKLDLSDNKFISSTNPVGSWTGSAYTDATGLIATGRNGGVWNGPGITTTMTDATNGSGFTAIGVARGSEVKGIAATQTDVWGGQTVTGGDALVMYTYGGDANLSGNVDIDDYGQIDFNTSIGSVLTGWYNGDFDYSGEVDIDDYGIIDFVIGIQGAPFATAGGLSLTAVPEPTGTGLLVVAAPLGLQRRTRRR